MRLSLHAAFAAALLFGAGAILLRCDLFGFTDKKETADSTGGAGADFDASQYYTKGEVNSLLGAVYAQAFQSGGDQNVSSNTSTDVSLQSLSAFPNSAFTLSGTGGITCLRGGLYMVVGIVDFPDDATGIRVVGLKVNGSPIKAVGMIGPGTIGNGWSYVSVTYIVKLSESDTVSMYFYHTRGTDLPLFNHTHLTLAKIAN